MNNSERKKSAHKLSIRFVILYICITAFIQPLFTQLNKLDLSGKWSFKLDSTDVGIAEKWYLTTFSETINLPGTTDDAGFGIKNILEPKLEKPQVLRLTRKNSYVGAAWYSRNIVIPSSWKKKNKTLKLERVIWETRVWVDGKEVASKQESLVTPHYFDLTEYLTKGKHKLTVRVDNRKKYDISVNDMAHAYTNETQIKWNGIVGEISCIAQDEVSIENIQIYPNITSKSARIVLSILNTKNKPVTGKLNIGAILKKTGQKIPEYSIHFNTKDKHTKIEINYPMGENALLWDEFNPNIYTLTATITGKRYQSVKSTDFGLRAITNKNSQLQINGKRIFVRGTLECSIFPLKGYPPTDKAGWEKVYKTAKAWGLNHIRFHSWCPPKVAFEVADEMGFYLQVELPLWSLVINQDKSTNDFLYSEADKIINEYGNHPSFCFWSIGNELQPDFVYLNNFVDRLKSKDPRHLYSNTSFTFEKGHGLWPEHNDDFWVTQYTKKGWVRGQGVFDSESPSFAKDYSTSTEGLTIPLITHEIGQYAVYPNLNEIEKYTGVLDPLNFKAVKADLIKKNKLHKAEDYLLASGKLAAILYKEEIERSLKTNGISGFQLLDLHDFPGQGTALVGLLDAFWDSKGIIKPEEFRQFCAPVVPLIRYQKATYTNKETFEADIEIANYSGATISEKKLNWRIQSDNTVLKSGSLAIPNLQIGSTPAIGKISFQLSEIKQASSLNIVVEIENTEYKNNWQIWVYPTELKIEKDNIIITVNKKEAIDALVSGKKVLYSPKKTEINGLEGKFVQVFWSPVHFPDQPGTMGLLINPKHKAFAHFPTEMHTNWQWWDLCKNSKTLITDSIQGIEPIVENIDNFMKNRNLCSIFETNAGNGQLIFSSMDLLTNIETRPEARQLLYSLIEYMKSSDFEPKKKFDMKNFELLISTKP